jgi:uncharacterized protein YjbJ (UPF0337 family)
MRVPGPWVRVEGALRFLARERQRVAREEPAMGADDRVRNAAQQAGGKIKEAAGHATDDDKLVAEGKADQATAKIKDKAEDVKDVFRKG